MCDMPTYLAIQVVSLLVISHSEVDEASTRADGNLSVCPTMYYFPPLAAATFGRFAPYFERPLRRFETPSLSRAPRTI
jgi:hypothetical protein